MEMPTSTTQNATPQSEEGNAEEPPKTGVWGFFHRAGARILGVMDYIGESVVEALGLDDSKFQYVIDGMDKEDWEKAVTVDRERRLEDAIMEAAEELQAQDNQLQSEGGDVEGGEDMERKKIKEYMDLVRDRVTTEFWEKEIAENPEVEREIRQVVPDEVSPMDRPEENVVSVENVQLTDTTNNVDNQA